MRAVRIAKKSALNERILNAASATPPVSTYQALAMTAGDETSTASCGAIFRGNRGSMTNKRYVVIGRSVSQHRRANENNAHPISLKPSGTDA